jgi:hypothetical protein
MRLVLMRCPCKVEKTNFMVDCLLILLLVDAVPRTVFS